MYHQLHLWTKRPSYLQRKENQVDVWLCDNDNSGTIFSRNSRKKRELKVLYPANSSWSIKVLKKQLKDARNRRILYPPALFKESTRICGVLGTAEVVFAGCRQWVASSADNLKTLIKLTKSWSAFYYHCVPALLKNVSVKCPSWRKKISFWYNF